MNITYDKENKTLNMLITEEVDHYMVEKLRSRADFEIQKHMPKKIIMDFEKVSFMDSAGIGMIIGRYKTAKLVNSTFEICNVKPQVKKVLEMSGILKIISIADR